MKVTKMPFSSHMWKRFQKVAQWNERTPEEMLVEAYQYEIDHYQEHAAYDYSREADYFRTEELPKVEAIEIRGIRLTDEMVDGLRKAMKHIGNSCWKPWMVIAALPYLEIHENKMWFEKRKATKKWGALYR